MKKIIVIGSGFGGLSIASRLRSNGFDITLIEKQPDLGGRARTFFHEGYKYDAGPTVITAPYLIDELFSLHSEKLSDYVNLLPVKPWYRFLFDNINMSTVVINFIVHGIFKLHIPNVRAVLYGLVLI